MQHSKRSLLFKTLPLSIGVNFILALFSCIAPCPAKAQIPPEITPDATLGDKSSVVVPDNFKGSDINRINGGAIQGSNLFHSFKEFNVVEKGAYFTNPGGITNILTRVTGGNASNILGTLGVLGPANLFLINPNGIVFGPNARLDMGGSFVASTADSLVFDNGLEFSATNPQAPLLTVNVPVGLRFRDASGKIINRSQATVDGTSIGLQLPPQKTLALIGGNVDLEGGWLLGSDVQIEIASVADSSLVNFINSDTGYKFDYSGVENFQNILLSDQAIVNINTNGSGSIRMQGRNVTLNGESRLFINNSGSQYGGGVFIQAEQLTLDNASISADVRGLGQGGNVTIETQDLLVQNGARISTATFGDGKGGTVKIKATDSVVIEGESQQGLFSGVQSVVAKGASGNAGEVEINTASFLLKDGARLDTTTFGGGNGGKVTIDAKDSVVIEGESRQGLFSGVLNVVAGGAVGDAGEVEINTASFLLKDGARLDTTTFGGGNGGKVTIDAKDSVVIEGESRQGLFSGVLSVVAGGASGDAGGVEIKTASFLLKDGNRLSTTTFGVGKGGTVKINATDSVVIEGESSRQVRLSGIESVVAEGASGNAGAIDIDTPSLLLKGGARLDTTTFGDGNGGIVKINATDSVVIEGKSSGQARLGGIESVVAEGASGNAGAIDIDTPSFTLRNGALLATSTLGESDAGNITVTANRFEITTGGGLLATTRGNGAAGNIFLQVEDNITLAEENSGIFANTEAGSTGRGGNIFIDTQTTLIQNGAELSVNSRGSGKGGDIFLQTNFLTLDRGTISAETAKETGGNISLEVADLLLMSDDSKITTSAGIESQPGAIGNGGNIDINTQFIVAPPSKPKGSDITANATYGNGGRVDITATGIFGIEFRDKPRDLLNDITASSEFGGNPGVVNINQVIDPSQNLVELPANVVDPNDQIAQNPCSKGVGSEFTITGRGGLPRSPNEDLSQKATQVGLVEPVSIVSNVKPPQKISSSHNSKSQIPSPIVPVQGWVFNNKGEVVLTAYNPNVIGIHRLPKNLNSCLAR